MQKKKKKSRGDVSVSLQLGSAKAAGLLSFLPCLSQYGEPGREPKETHAVVGTRLRATHVAACPNDRRRLIKIRKVLKVPKRGMDNICIFTKGWKHVREVSIGEA